MVDSADGCGVRLVFSYGSAPSPSPSPFFICCSARRFAVLCRHVSSRTRTQRCQDVVRWKGRYFEFEIIITAEPELWEGRYALCLICGVIGPVGRLELVLARVMDAFNGSNAISYDCVASSLHQHLSTTTTSHCIGTAISYDRADRFRASSTLFIP